MDEQAKKSPAEEKEEALTCMLCGTGEDARPLLLMKYQGGETAICPRCLPRLIHPERAHG